MAAAPTRWTDERLDDAADRLTRFEANVDNRFDRLERGVDHRFDKMDAQFERADAVEGARFAAVHAEIATFTSKMDKLNRRVTSGLLTVVAAVIIKVFLG